MKQLAFFFQNSCSLLYDDAHAIEVSHLGEDLILVALLDSTLDAQAFALFFCLVGDVLVPVLLQFVDTEGLVRDEGSFDTAKDIKLDAAVSRLFARPQDIAAPFRPYATQYDTYLLRYDDIRP
jgi:hypothetical protein